MSKLLINESPLTFQPSLAVAIGLNEAIVLQQVHYWIANAKNKGYEQDGYKWVYNTYAEWREDNFPFWSENTIQRTFASLEEKGLIVSIQPMKGKYDRTKYYRIEYTKLGTFEDTKMEVFEDTKMVRSLSESETITEKTTAPKGDLVDAVLKYEAKPQSIRAAIQEHFRLKSKFENKFDRQWLEWAVNENITPEQIARAAQVWKSDKRFNWAQPTLKGIFEKWLMLMDAGETAQTEIIPKVRIIK